ncbi:MAG TPA: hypothetical protein VFO44_05615 [Steroidobacteraceae bacterium]|nr:hypothetical protein [Steroidobacteraceae bacterium]
MRTADDPCHRDDYGTKPRNQALKEVATFADEIKVASPQPAHGGARQ